MPVLLSGVPGIAVATTILQANRFSLWGPGKLFLSMTACGMPALTNYFTYDWIIKKDILLGKTPCSVCLETRAVSLQMLTGVIMPTCIGLMGANHSLVGLVWKKQSFRGLALDKRDLLKCKNIVLASAIIQAIAVGFLVNQQRSEWLNVIDELYRRKEASSKENYSSKSKIITDTSLF